MPIHKLSVDYDDPFFDYKKYWREREYENEAEKIALKKLFQLVLRKEIIADVAAGFGRLTSVYSPQFKSCVLIDPSERLLNEARKLARLYKNLTFQKAFVEKLPLKDKSIDVVLFIRIFHHLENPQPAVQEFRRILKPGGFLILEFPNKIHLKNCLKALLRLDFGCFSQKPEDISKQEKVIPFLNYHPQYVKNLLSKHKFKIIKTLSVSNFRHPFCKKIIPLSCLCFLESKFQSMGVKINFGPSIFILAQKCAN